MLTDNAKILYDELLSYQTWRNRRKMLEQKLYELEHDIAGLKSVNFDRIPTTSTGVSNDKKILSYIEKKTKIQNEIMRLSCNMNYVEFLLNKKIFKKSEKEVLTGIFIYGLTFKDTANIYFYNERYIYDMVYNLVNKINAYLEGNKFIVKKR